jgi:hypothetical protein
MAAYYTSSLKVKSSGSKLSSMERRRRQYHAHNQVRWTEHQSAIAGVHTAFWFFGAGTVFEMSLRRKHLVSIEVAD